MRFYQSNRHACIFFFLFLATALNSRGYTQDQFHQQSNRVQSAAAAYSYLYNLDFTIARIGTSYTQLQNKAALSKTTLNSNFGEARRNLKSYLLSVFTENTLDSIQRIIKNVGSTWLSFDELALIDASEYLEKLYSLANGNIPSPYLETILAYNYKDKPAAEFLAGYVQSFYSKGHPKSADISLKLKVPKSWKVLETERPTIVKKFQAQSISNVSKEVMITIAKERIDNIDSLPQNILRLLLKDLSKSMADIEGYTLVSYKDITLEGIPAGLVEIDLKKERLEYKMVGKMVIYSLIFNNRFITVTGSVIGQEASRSSVESEYKNYKPLFDQIANSLVLYSE